MRKILSIVPILVFLISTSTSYSQTITKGKIAREDLRYWSGNSAYTFTRTTSTGGSQTVTKIGNVVDVIGAYGTDFTAIENAVSNISGNCIIELGPRAWTISDDLTIPAGSILRVVDGGTLTISSGKTLTLSSGYIDAGHYQIFAAYSSGVLAGLREANLTWFADIGDSASYLNAMDTDCVLYLDEATTLTENVSYDVEVQIRPQNVITLATYTLTIANLGPTGPLYWINTNSTGYANIKGSKIIPQWFGAIAGDSADDSAAIQDAVECAQRAVTGDATEYPIVESYVEFPPGKYDVASGETITIAEGVIICGSGRSSTVITHGGGSVPLFTTTASATHNVEILIKDMTLYGAGATSTAAIDFEYCYRNSGIENVNIRNFNDNIQLSDCWTFKIARCALADSIQYNIYWLNATAGIIEDSRIDGAGSHNIYLGSSTSYTVNLTIRGSAIQTAENAGIYGVDIGMLNVESCWFEGNNQSDGNYADVHLVDGDDDKVSQLVMSTSYGAKGSTAETTTRFVHMDRGRLSMFGCYNPNGGNYKYGVELGADVSNASILGCRVEGTTKDVYTAGTATEVNYISNQNGLSLSPENYVTIAYSSDNFDVSNYHTVFVNTAGSNMVIGGLTGGVAGQHLRIVKVSSANTLTIEHDEDVGDQDIYTNDASDIVLSSYGGVNLVFNGTIWFVVSE